MQKKQINKESKQKNTLKDGNLTWPISFEYLI